MKLNEAQSLFKKYLLNPQEASQDGSLKAAGKLSLEEAFQLYHRSYLKRLSKTLTKTYEAVRWIAQEEAFEKVSSKYIHSQPSTSYDVADYGHNFPEYLKVSSLGREMPFLHDLARFEWAFKNIQKTPTPDPLPVEHIQELLHSGDFKVHFVEAMEIFQSPYAIYNIWHQRNSAPADLKNIQWRTPESLLLYKKQNKVLVQRINSIEAQVLLELKEGRPVSETLADFSNILPPAKITELFHKVMKAGIIEDVLMLET